ncbi:Serine/threonine-protein kinase cek1 [Podospora fimiseda]|uniref:non-specific serine/threonine protein kinase n=1 Tax=Podospora fimiseda TaxID=252190 RepID=A0AAN7BXI5_9PEZI|nr:Serine/threonine-protein kinase cek1 [Podospora fimiseda]
MEEESQPIAPNMLLAPPAVTSLRAAAGAMERSLSEDIREEREELREAAEQTLNVLVDLNLDGTIRWVSPSWVDVIGTQPDSVTGKPIVDLIVSEDKTVFEQVVEGMKKDDRRSQFLRFAAHMGPLAKLYPLEMIGGSAESATLPIVELEAQGIMVYSGASEGESHSMWMIRPWVPPREIKIDLPAVIVDSLGSGAEILASYLTQLAEAGPDDLAAHPPPLPVLCRICERQISPWWFEKHTDLCLQEHRAEMDVQMAQDNLTEHRSAIVRVLDALEARRSRPLAGEQTLVPLAEYKGFVIGPPRSTTSSPGTSSPGPGAGRSRERSSGVVGHARARSFAVRRPQARIVELLLDLCDTAIEISTPAIKETSQTSGEFRTQSPQSDGRITQVLQWETPTTNTLEQEQGLALLCADTERVAKEKVEAVFRHRRILEYAERIRIEFAYLVQDCIEAAMRKAQKIASGQLSDSTEDEDEAEEQEIVQEEEEEGLEAEEEDAPPTEEGVFVGSFDGPSTLALALQKADINEDPDKRRLSTALLSAGSGRSSPRECPTPRSHRGTTLNSLAGPNRSRRESMIFESDAGAESDGSLKSASVTSRHPRTDSPMSDFSGLRRQASSRQHHRKSLILPGAVSPRRQESPCRIGPPSSPLRISKPRNLPFLSDGLVSPEASPMLPSSEFTSPNVGHHSHHRRQSSAAISTSTGEIGTKPPLSPRLSAVVGGPQAKAVPPSIKDFEIIKPISKGAFGSVYLSKKKSTGEYFAIKVLKKADMVAKNQVTNVKAERAIMMWQGESDFVAKLYWTFSSKDYLYLVMEYLNGGDCAALIKILGGLNEDWAKKYLGEVILGVEHLHSRGIVHRDLKPDNLLIDQKGHLKLTDFGLSRMGLIGRQKRALNSNNEVAPDLLKQGPFARSTSMASSRSTSLDLHGRNQSPGSTPQMTPSECAGSLGQPSYFSLGAVSQEPRRLSTHRSDSGGSEALTQMLGTISLHDPQVSYSSAILSPADGSEVEGGGSPDLASLSHVTTHTSIDSHRGTPPQPQMAPPNWALFDPTDTNRRFVGTPDYLAPETIKGEPQDETSDWWSVGCILYEFLCGIPPFHAEEADQVFENILARRLSWPEWAHDSISPEAKDLVDKLLCSDPQQRLGANREEKYQSGGEEIRSHPWFKDLNWDTLLQDEAEFVPNLENPEDTEYFDSRGATLQSFVEEIEDQSSPPASAPPADYHDRPHDALSRVRSQVNSMKRGLMPLHIPPHVRDLKSRRLSEPVVADDFGSFTFKNLPVLEKANKDMIQKLRAEALAAQSKPISPGGLGSLVSPGPALEGSPVISNPVQRTLSNAKASQRPQSPSGLSHVNSSPSRASQPSSPLLVSFVAGQGADSRRKASSNTSSLSQASGNSLQPGSFFDVPRGPPVLQKAATTIAATSVPVKTRSGPAAPPSVPVSPQKAVPNHLISTPRHGSNKTAGRSRSLTVGSQEGSPVAPDLLAAHHKNRRSQVFDMSPSSSDNEGDKAANALLRVQRRRQSSRRMSYIAANEGIPFFRPLDILVCDNHPIYRMVMEKLLEKLRCRTIAVTTATDAIRIAMGDIKFDIIFLEYSLPELNGGDVARMIRETKHANTNTPLVATTAYLKDLTGTTYFDTLIEKPISSSKITDVLANYCQWKPPTPSQSNNLSLVLPHPVPSGLRQESLRLEDSPTSGSSGYANRSSSSFREDSISSSMFGDSESVMTDDIPVVISRKATGDWDEGGLGITGVSPGEDVVLGLNEKLLQPHLVTQESAPGQMEHQPVRTKAPHPQRSFEKLKAKRESIEKRRYEGSVDSADDEDDELGGHAGGNGNNHTAPRQHGRNNKSALPSSKLGIEMMRANSHDSIVTESEGTCTLEPPTQVVTPNVELQAEFPRTEASPSPFTPSPTTAPKSDTTIVISTPRIHDVGPNNKTTFDVEETPRSISTTGQMSLLDDDDPTPRPVTRMVERDTNVSPFPGAI